MEKRTEEGLKKKYDYVNRYIKEKTITKLIRFNKETEKDLIDHLSKMDNSTGYIKDLIRKDIKKEG